MAGDNTADDDRIATCEFEGLFELAADAKDDGVYAKDRPEAQWFRYEDAGMICLWEPQNRSATKRISHWWVRPERRGEGIGSDLLDYAITVAKASDADRLDIYVYDPDPLDARGFRHEGKGQAVDDAEYYVLDVNE